MINVKKVFTLCFLLSATISLASEASSCLIVEYPFASEEFGIVVVRDGEVDNRFQVAMERASRFVHRGRQQNEATKIAQYKTAVMKELLSQGYSIHMSNDNLFIKNK